MRSLVLALDQSTQGTKALLFDETGAVVGRTSRAHEQYVDERGWVEHDPEEIMTNVLACARDVCKAARVVAGLARAKTPGRMELIGEPGDRVVALVDYAHNKLSYQRFFSSVTKEFPGHRIIVVMGAPGGKAYERRTELPQEAAKWADHLIYTEEDPAHDPVEEICAQMVAATPAGPSHEAI